MTNDEQVFSSMPVIKFRNLSPFHTARAISSPTFPNFVVAWFRVTACGDPLQARRIVGCDSGVRH